MCAEFDHLTAAGEPVTSYLRADRDALAGCRIGRLCIEASVTDERIHQPVSASFATYRERLTAAFSGTEIPVDPTALADLAIAVVRARTSPPGPPATRRRCATPPRP